MDGHPFRIVYETTTPEYLQKLSLRLKPFAAAMEIWRADSVQYLCVTFGCDIVQAILDHNNETCQKKEESDEPA